MTGFRYILPAVVLAAPILACSAGTRLPQPTPIASSILPQDSQPPSTIGVPAAEGSAAEADVPAGALIIYETIVYVEAAGTLMRQTGPENSMDDESAATWAILAALLGSKVDEADANGVPSPLAKAWGISMAAESALTAALESLLEGTPKESLKENLADASDQAAEAATEAERVLIENYGVDTDTISQSRQRAQEELTTALSAMGGLTNGQAQPQAGQANPALVRLGATKLTDNGGEVFGYVWGEVVNESDQWLGEVLLSVFFFNADGQRIGALESSRAGGATIAVPQIAPHDVGVFVIPKILVDITGDLDHVEVGLFNVETIPDADRQYTDISFAADHLAYDLPYVDLTGSFTNEGASVCYNPIVAVGFYGSDGKVVGVVDTSGSGPINPGESERIDANDLVWLNEPYASVKTWAQCDSAQE